MDNLVRVYEGVLSDERCEYFVNMFEQYPSLHENQINSNGKTLTRINLMESNDSPFAEDVVSLANIFMSAVQKYKDDIGIQQLQFPARDGLEAMKIKRYQPGGQDSFPSHVDVNSLENSKRFLVMFIYLTDNQKGQTTLNMKDDLFVSSCKKGSVLLFPPYWPWVHAGEKPVQDSKYILGSYLHYAE